jgi:hypothetical protein
MIRNCLGLTVQDFKNNLLSNLDPWLLDWILERDCKKTSPVSGGSPLSRFDTFSVFIAKKVLDHLNHLDKNNGALNGSDSFGFIKDNMDDHLDDFNRRECSGHNIPIDQFVANYKPDKFMPMYPDTISDSKKSLVMDYLRKTNFDSANRDNFNPDANNNVPYMVLTSSERGDDMMFPSTNIFGSSILTKIPVEDLENFDPDKMIFTKCFKVKFELENYFVPDNPDSRPIMTELKLNNIKKLHNEILLPIYRFYYGDEKDTSCKLRIHGGLMSMFTANSRMGASNATRHVYGQSVNFSLVSVPGDTIMSDLSEGRIGINFGVAAQVNGMYITLPYEYEGYEIKNMVLLSPNFDSDDIKAKFI